MKTLTASLLILISSTIASISADNYISIALPKGVSVLLPKNWKGLSKEQLITLDATVQSRLETTGLYDATHDLLFAANYYDDANKIASKFNIRYYPELDLTQQDAKEATESDVKELDAALKEILKESLEAFSSSIVEWRGTRKESINSHIAFVTEYTRSPIQDSGIFCVRLVRLFRGSASYTITVSYRLSDERLLRPICDKIIKSINNE